MSNEELSVFAMLQEDPINDAQIELLIYTCFLVFMRTISMEHLEQAIQQAEGWVAITAYDHPDQARRTRILDTISDWKCQLEYKSKLKIERSVQTQSHLYQRKPLGMV